MSDCIFCKIIAGEIPSIKVYDDAEVLAFMDVNPINQGHCLVIPKAHAATIYDLTPAQVTAVFQTGQKIAKAIREAIKPDGLNLIQSNGRAASQVIDHFHLHLIPRFENDSLSKLMNWDLKQGDFGEIEASAAKIKAAF